VPSRESTVARGPADMNSAIDPTPPFPRYQNRLRLVAPLALLLILSQTVSLDRATRLFGFAIGLNFFARPQLEAMVERLKAYCPGFWASLGVKNLLLQKVPNHTQLTLALLRAGEQAGMPLPAFRYGQQAATYKDVKIDASVIAATGPDLPLGETEYQLDSLAAPEDAMLEKAGGPACEIQGTGGHKTGKLIGLLKRTSRVTVKMALSVDKLRAKAGKQSAQNRLGIVPSRRRNPANQGPCEFRVRSEGKEGVVRVGNVAGIETIAFEHEWTVQVSSITELKKLGGLGIKSKFVVGWAMESTVTDGLEIRERSGRTYVLTAVVERDQLFDRLCAMGPQKWEVW
jgi:hypothetical protein